MRSLLPIAIIVLALTTPVPASAFCFSSFHSPKVVEQKVETVNGVPVAIKTAPARKPDSYCQTVMRSVGVSLAVTTVITSLKLGIIVLTGIPIL